MSLPIKITTIGNQDAANAFKITFSEALALPPQIEAWDNTETFPKRVNYGKTTLNQIFVGTVGNNNKPMLYAASTTVSSPGSNWKPSTAIVGGATKNRMKGTTNYIVDTVTPNAGESILFNLGIEVPFDSETTSGQMDYTIQTRYFFSGPIPVTTFYANSGTEAAPVWEEITPVLHGIRLCDYSVEGTYYLTIPEENVIDATIAWITYKNNVTAIFTGNANLKESQSITFTGNSSLLKTMPASFSGNAELRSDLSIAGDSNLKKQISASFSGKAHLN